MSGNKLSAPLNKISVSTVYGKIKTEIRKDADGENVKVLPKELFIMRIFGQATGYEVKTSQYGDSLKFSGIFKGINLETGEEFTSGYCFLPAVIEPMLGSVLDNVESGAEFALDVKVIPANNSYGYEYRVQPIIEVAESPVLTALEDKIAGLAALPSPRKESTASKKTPAAKKKVQAKGKRK